MPWFVYIDSGVAIEDHEASTEQEAIEEARIKFIEWLQRDYKPEINLAWLVEYEE